MALQKEKQLLNGTTGNYWKITSVTADKVKNKLQVVISLFISKEASDEGKLPLQAKHSFVSDFTKEQLAGDLTLLGYNLIKEKMLLPEPTDIRKPLEIIAHRDLSGAIDA